MAFLQLVLVIHNQIFVLTNAQKTSATQLFSVIQSCFVSLGPLFWFYDPNCYCFASILPLL